MARRIDAWMNGVRLSDIGPIYIKQVNEPGPEMEITYIERPTRGGQEVARRRRKVLKVSIVAQIHELWDLARRTEIRQAIAAWSEGGILELSNHPGQQLHVLSTGEPGVGSVRDFNSEIDIELEANEIPYWEEKNTVTVSGTGSSGSYTVTIPGTAKEVPVGAVFTPSAAVTDLTVTAACGGVTKSIQLTGMSVSGAITFGRDAFDRITIYSGSTNLMPYRTQASADDLIIPAGAATMSFSAGVSGTMLFTAKGRWL